MANLQLQGGSIYLEEYLPNGTLGDKFYPGTTDEVKFNLSLDKVEHYDTEVEEQVLDGQDVIKRNMAISFITRDINDQFNKIAYLANQTPYTQVAVSAQTVSIASAKLDTVIYIGYKDITALVVTDSAGAITYTEGVDYTYDRKWGTLIPLSTGSIVDASVLNLTVDANAVNGVIGNSFSVDKREFRMTYQGRSSQGRNEKHIFEKVSLAMEGDRTLKQETKEYALISFTGAVLKTNGKIHTMETY